MITWMHVEGNGHGLIWIDIMEFGESEKNHENIHL